MAPTYVTEILAYDLGEIPVWKGKMLRTIDNKSYNLWQNLNDQE
jgi:hypothetical protein